MELTMPGAFNGFSTQPDHLRNATQCEFSKNVLHDVARGDVARPGSTYKFALSRALGSTVHYHKIERDETEKYLVICDGYAGEPILIYTKDGTKCTVTYDATATRQYFESFGSKPVRFVTQADTTFTVNPNFPPYLSTASWPGIAPRVLINVKKTLPVYGVGVSLSITVRGVAGSITLGLSPFVNGPILGADCSINSNALAAELAAQINAAVALSSGVLTRLVATAYGSYVSVTWSAGGGYTSYPAIYISGSDTQGNTCITFISGEQIGSGTFLFGGNTWDKTLNFVQKYSDLPPKFDFSNVFKIKNETAADDGYYVRYDTVKQVWVETYSPELDIAPVAANMPKQIVRTATNTFLVSNMTWASREVGDEVSNPTPSFYETTVPPPVVGFKSIDDIFFFRDRLGLISGVNIIMSKTGDYTNFWATTATEVLDDDPIDISLSATAQVSDIKAVVDFNEGLLLFSDEEQYILTSGQQALTPKTVTVALSTRFKFNTAIKPVLSGPNCYFLDSKNHVREYFVAPDSLINDAEDISKHIGEYLTGSTALSLEALPQQGMLFIQGTFTDKFTGLSTSGNLVYKQLWQGSEKSQSSWSFWTTKGKVFTFGTDLVILDGIYGHAMDLSDKEYVISDVMVDKMRTLNSGTGTYSSTTKQTSYTVTNPSMFNTVDTMVAFKASTYRELEIVSFNKSTGALVVKGDWSATVIYLGARRSSAIRFSRQYPRNANGASKLGGKLLYRRAKVKFRKACEFDLEVTPSSRTKVTNSWTSFTVNNSLLGNPTLESGEYSCLVMGDSKNLVIDVICDSHFPCTWESYAILAEYIPDRF